jgi:hypothetical protein
MITLDDLRTSEKLLEDLAWPFDFDILRASDNSEWIRLDPVTPFVVLAGESCGGVFLAYGSGDTANLPILYATSEGQAGRVASNLTEFLAILIAAPYWKDLLKFSGNGNLAEMRKTAVFMQLEYAEDFPDLPEARSRIMHALQIPLLDDPILALHDSIHRTDCTLVADDGWRYESLFNSFTSDDNRNWR